MKVYVTVISVEKINGHFCTRVIVCIDAADKTILSFNGDNRYIQPGKVFRREIVTQVDKTDYLIGQQLIQTFSFCLAIIIS